MFYNTAVENYFVNISYIIILDLESQGMDFLIPSVQLLFLT
jgi:hypothetical protein